MLAPPATLNHNALPVGAQPNFTSLQFFFTYLLRVAKLLNKLCRLM